MPGEAWPINKFYRDDRPAMYVDHEFHGSWFDACPLCGALVHDTDLHTTWHTNKSESESES